MVLLCWMTAVFALMCGVLRSVWGSVVLVVCQAGVAVECGGVVFTCGHACLLIAGRCAAVLLAYECAVQRARQPSGCLFKCAALCSDWLV
jgi:hypothetical protein